MRRLAVVALLSMIACGDSLPPLGPDMEDRLAAGPPLEVFLIAGQSNAVGGAKIHVLASSEQSELGIPLDIAFAQELECPTGGTAGPCEVTSGWSQLAPRRGGSFGIEISAGRRLRDRFGADVAIIKHASSGSNLYEDWNASGERDALWRRMNDFVDARLAELPDGSRIAGLFWIHGNADARRAGAAGEYADNLSWLVTRLREERGCVPVVIDRLHAADLLPYRDVVRAEQEGLAHLLPGVDLIDADDLTLRDDPPQHYTAQSFVTLGERMADAMDGCR